MDEGFSLNNSPKRAVTEGSLTAETGLTVNIFPWNWHITIPTSHKGYSFWCWFLMGHSRVQFHI